MKYTFAALRFSEDKNVAENVYWYLCDFPVKEGDCVIAPVGTHNGLQRACVERVVSETKENAPYDMRLIKRVAAKSGARKFPLGCAKNCRELGGLLIDGKRYTRFCAFLRSDFPAYMREDDAETLSDYGVTALVDMREAQERQKEECAQNFFPVYRCPVTEGTVNYLALSESAGMRSAIKACARAEGCILFGCSAGKERTGVLSALLLLAAGVRRESVLDDFLLCERLAGETRGKSQAPAFDGFLRTVIETGAEKYLRKLGIDDWETDRIKIKLTGHSTGR